MKTLVALVGMKHRGSERIVAAMKDGDPVTLIREPDNPYDPMAVQVWAAGMHVGYLKGTQVRPVAIAMDRSAASARAAPVATYRVTADRWPMIEIEDQPPRTS